MHRKFLNLIDNHALSENKQSPQNIEQKQCESHKMYMKATIVKLNDKDILRVCTFSRHNTQILSKANERRTNPK